MNEMKMRLVALDLMIAWAKPMKDRQEKELKKVRGYKGDDGAAKELFAKTMKSLKSAKTERKAIIAKLLKEQDTAGKR